MRLFLSLILLAGILSVFIYGCQNPLEEFECPAGYDFHDTYTRYDAKAHFVQRYNDVCVDRNDGTIQQH